MMRNDSTLRQPLGTKHVKYKPLCYSEYENKNGKSASATLVVHSIAAMREYARKSIEELRLEDYLLDRGPKVAFGTATVKFESVIDDVELNARHNHITAMMHYSHRSFEELRLDDYNSDVILKRQEKHMLEGPPEIPFVDFVPYKPKFESDLDDSFTAQTSYRWLRFTSINCMEEYKNMSTDELRLKYYEFLGIGRTMKLKSLDTPGTENDHLESLMDSIQIPDSSKTTLKSDSLSKMWEGYSSDILLDLMDSSGADADFRALSFAVISVRCRYLGRLTTALELLQRALQLANKAFKSPHKLIALILYEMFIVKVKTGVYNEAASIGYRSLSMMKESNVEPLVRARLALQLGALNTFQDKTELAVVDYTSALELLRATDVNIERRRAVRGLLDIYFALGQFDEMSKLLESENRHRADKAMMLQRKSNQNRTNEYIYEPLPSTSKSEVSKYVVKKVENPVESDPTLLNAKAQDNKKSNNTGNNTIIGPRIVISARRKINKTNKTDTENNIDISSLKEPLIDIGNGLGGDHGITDSFESNVSDLNESANVTVDDDVAENTQDLSNSRNIGFDGNGLIGNSVDEDALVESGQSDGNNNFSEVMKRLVKNNKNNTGPNVDIAESKESGETRGVNSVNSGNSTLENNVSLSSSVSILADATNDAVNANGFDIDSNMITVNDSHSNDEAAIEIGASEDTESSDPDLFFTPKTTLSGSSSNDGFVTLQDLRERVDGSEIILKDDDGRPESRADNAPVMVEERDSDIRTDVQSQTQNNAVEKSSVVLTESTDIVAITASSESFGASSSGVNESFDRSPAKMSRIGSTTTSNTTTSPNVIIVTPNSTQIFGSTTFTTAPIGMFRSASRLNFSTPPSKTSPYINFSSVPLTTASIQNLGSTTATTASVGIFGSTPSLSFGIPPSKTSFNFIFSPLPPTASSQIFGSTPSKTTSSAPSFRFGSFPPKISPDVVSGSVPSTASSQIFESNPSTTASSQILASTIATTASVGLFGSTPGFNFSTAPSKTSFDFIFSPLPPTASSQIFGSTPSKTTSSAPSFRFGSFPPKISPNVISGSVPSTASCQIFESNPSTTASSGIFGSKTTNSDFSGFFGSITAASTTSNNFNIASASPLSFNCSSPSPNTRTTGIFGSLPSTTKSSGISLATTETSKKFSFGTSAGSPLSDFLKKPLYGCSTASFGENSKPSFVFPATNSGPIGRFASSSSTGFGTSTTTSSQFGRSVTSSSSGFSRSATSSSSGFGTSTTNSSQFGRSATSSSTGFGTSTTSSIPLSGNSVNSSISFRFASSTGPAFCSSDNSNSLSTGITANIAATSRTVFNSATSMAISGATPATSNSPIRSMTSTEVSPEDLIGDINSNNSALSSTVASRGQVGSLTSTSYVHSSLSSPIFHDSIVSPDNTNNATLTNFDMRSATPLTIHINHSPSLRLGMRCGRIIKSGSGAAYAFSGRPVQIDQCFEITVPTLGCGEVSFGLTSVNPSFININRIPEGPWDCLYTCKTPSTQYSTQMRLLHNCLLIKNNTYTHTVPVNTLKTLWLLMHINVEFFSILTKLPSVDFDTSLLDFDATDARPLPIHNNRLNVVTTDIITMPSDGLNGLVFSAYPVLIDQWFKIVVIDNDSSMGSICIGLTSEDPMTVNLSRFPEGRSENEFCMHTLIHKLLQCRLVEGRLLIRISEYEQYLSREVDTTKTLWMFARISEFKGSFKILSDGIADEHPMSSINAAIKEEPRVAAPQPSPRPNLPPPSVRTDVAVNRESEKSAECIICFERQVDSVLYSCGHCCMCHTCAVNLWRGKGDGKCPICRKFIRDVIKLYKS